MRPKDLYIDKNYRDWLVPVWSRDRGARLKNARMKLFMDQRELAEKFGVKQQTISKIEQGHLALTDTRLNKIIEALGERLFLYVMTGEGAAGVETRTLESNYYEFRYRLNRVNRSHPVSKAEQALIDAHTKHILKKKDYGHES